MIEIHGMKKIYKGTDFELEALKDVALSVEDGEFVAIMGESGSGKSTLLNCIGLMDHFEEGTYDLHGIQIHTLSEREKNLVRRDNISFIFQNYELMRNYTLYENIEIPLLAKNVRKKEREMRIEESAERLGILDILDKFPYQVSGGQQQRAAIVRAITADNPLILADEPTGALDSRNSQEFMQNILSLKDFHKTIIMVTHDKKIADYSDRIIYLEDGRIV